MNLHLKRRPGDMHAVCGEQLRCENGAQLGNPKHSYFSKDWCPKCRQRWALLRTDWYRRWVARGVRTLGLSFSLAGAPAFLAYKRRVAGVRHG
jgi:hypothetical protein